MNPGEIISTQQLHNLEVSFWYPMESDAEPLCEYINTLSKERTYIQLQGEQVSLEDEKKYLDNLLKKIKDGTGGSIVAWADGQIVGYLDLRPKEKATRHVINFGITVRKEYRGKGIGKQLILLAIQQIRLNFKHHKIMTLSAHADNELAIALYRKLGFVQYGQLPDGVFREGQYHDLILMYKKL